MPASAYRHKARLERDRGRLSCKVPGCWRHTLPLLEIHLRACGQVETSSRMFAGEGRRQKLIGVVGAKKPQGG